MRKNKADRDYGPTTEVELQSGAIVLISAGDFIRVRMFRWAVTPPKTTRGLVYAVRGIPGGGSQSLHRFILDPPDHLIVDHKDGNGLNCTRGNLRICNIQQNSWNRASSDHTMSPYKGVTWHPSSQKWLARINGEQIAPLFDSPEEAAHAYDDAARLLFGEYACVNFPRYFSERGALQGG